MSTPRWLSGPCIVCERHLEPASPTDVALAEQLGMPPLPREPVRWVCCVCGHFVCRRCALVEPDTYPLEYCEDTLCSVACREAKMVMERMERGR